MATKILLSRFLFISGFFIAASLLGCAQDLRGSIDQLATQIANSMPEGKQLRLAVADFPDLQGVISDFGRFVANRLTTRLAQSPKLLLIERQRLDQVLTELKFSMSDLVDPTKAKQLGKMVGVEAIVVGSISDIGNQIDVDARIIEIETNRMLSGVTTSISKDPTVTKMLESGREEITGTKIISETPKESAYHSGEGLSKFRWDGKACSFELSSIDVVGAQIKLTFIYTNKLESPALGYIVDIGIDKTYVLDSSGNRYAL